MIWKKYYSSHPPDTRMEGSSWWKSHLKLIPLYKQHSTCKLGNSQSILLWKDRWLDEPLINKFLELHSFVKNDAQTAESWIISENPSQFIHTPLYEQAFSQYNDLLALIDLHKSPQRNDICQG